MPKAAKEVKTVLCDLGDAVARITLGDYSNYAQVFQPAEDGMPAQSVYISLQDEYARDHVRQFAHSLLDAIREIEEKEKQEAA